MKELQQGLDAYFHQLKLYIKKNRERKENRRLWEYGRKKKKCFFLI
jgi:hypothetical protein